MTFLFYSPLRRHRASICLALALAIGLLLLWMLAGPPLVAYAQNRHTLLAQHDRLARYLTIGARRDAVAAALADTDELRTDIDAYLLPAGTQSVLQADLQALVRDLVTRHGGQVVSTQVDERRDAVDRVGVRLHFKSALDDLVDTLHALEFGKPTLIVSEFNVQVGRPPARRGAGTPVALDVRLVAHAFASTAVAK